MFGEEETQEVNDHLEEKEEGYLLKFTHHCCNQVEKNTLNEACTRKQNKKGGVKKKTTREKRKGEEQTGDDWKRWKKILEGMECKSSK